MGFIKVIQIAVCCQFLFQEVEGHPRLSVVISAGQVKDDNSRVREVAVFLRHVEPAQLERGLLSIYENDSRTHKIAEIRTKDRIVEQTGHSARFFTNVKFDQSAWKKLRNSTRDLGYCCEFRVDEAVIASGCIRKQPRWMEEMLPEIGRLPLKNLAIPGTHQSGTYNAEIDYANRYRDCQEEDVFSQLLYGIRALDLRPGTVAKESSPYNGFEYWIFHDKFSTNNALKSILEDVRAFLDTFPKEVVIIDFHEFSKGFEDERAYLGLEKLVKDVLGAHIYPYPYATERSLSDIIGHGHRAILTFQKNEHLRNKFSPGVEHIWGNTDNIKTLRERLKAGQAKRKPQTFSCSMAQTTAQDVLSVIFDRYRGGVRGLAHRDNFEISSWYAEDQTMREDANIIAMDYFASSDIVDICREINLDRGRNYRD